MKKQFLISAVLFFMSNFGFAQMEDGTYTYENAKIKLTLVVAGDGHTIDAAIIKDIATGKEEKGKGEFMSANETGWYQFQTEICNYDFDFKYNALTINLSSFDCKNGIKPAKYILKKK